MAYQLMGSTKGVLWKTCVWHKYTVMNLMIVFYNNNIKIYVNFSSYVITLLTLDTNITLVLMLYKFALCLLAFSICYYLQRGTVHVEASELAVIYGARVVLFHDARPRLANDPPSLSLS